MRHLDTNIVIAYLNGDQEVAEKIKAYLPEIALSTLVVAELRFGARASARFEENLKSLELFLQLVQLVDFDERCADTYGHLRLALRKKGKPTNDMDLLIASIAKTHDAILVTHNTKHFSNIDDLGLEDWLT